MTPSLLARRATLALVLASAACGDGATEPAPRPAGPAPVASVTVTPGSAALHPSWTQRLDVRLADARGRALTGRAVVFASSDESVATVSADGVVTARAPGGATITVTSEGRSAAVAVAVTDAPVRSLAVATQTAVLSDGTQGAVTATAYDERGNALAGRAVAWSSSDESIVTVLPSGRVSAIRPGEATVTAVVEGLSASVTLRVRPRVETVSVSVGTTTLVAGESTPLAVTLRDAGGSELAGREIDITFSNPIVAYVAEGRVVANHPGTATMVVESEGRSATVEITVLEPVAILSLTPRIATVPLGATVQLAAKPLDLGGRPLAGRVVTWSSSNPLVATVDASGMVTARQRGVVTITAICEGVRVDAQVTVN